MGLGGFYRGISVRQTVGEALEGVLLAFEEFATCRHLLLFRRLRRGAIEIFQIGVVDLLVGFADEGFELLEVLFDGRRTVVTIAAAGCEGAHGGEQGAEE